MKGLWLITAAVLAAIGIGVGVVSISTPSTPPSIGLLPASPYLSSRIVLNANRVVAGAAITGSLILTNSGPAPIDLTYCREPAVEVVLTNSRFPAIAAFLDGCSPAPFTIARGINRLPISVITTYAGCSLSVARPARPACLRDKSGRYASPPLPAGIYQAVMVGDGIQLPPADPVTVTLVAPAAVGVPTSGDATRRACHFVEATFLRAYKSVLRMIQPAPGSNETFECVLTTRKRALAATNGGQMNASDGAAPVALVVVSLGETVSANVSHPPGARSPTGNLVTFTYDPATGNVLDFGLRTISTAHPAPDLRPLGAVSYASP